MGRIIKEFKLTSKSPEEIQEYLRNWFVQNHFSVKTWSSDGKPFALRKWWSWLGIKVSSHVGSIVAIRYDFTGCIIFEINLRKAGADTLFHGEFYAAGAEIYRGKEWDLGPKPGATGKLPRKDGYRTMGQLLQELKNLGNNT